MTLVMQVINAVSQNLIVNLQLRLPNLHLLRPLSLKMNFPYKIYSFLKSIWQVILQMFYFPSGCPLFCDTVLQNTQV